MLKQIKNLVSLKGLKANLYGLIHYNRISEKLLIRIAEESEKTSIEKGHNFAKEIKWPKN